MAAGEIPELLDKRFQASRDRLARQDELDSLVGKWTASRSQYQVMEELQSAGVPAGPVLNAHSLLTDPHFRDRGFFEQVDHPPGTGLGRREYIGRGWKMSGNPLHIRHPAPVLGEANQYILKDVLGLSDPEIEALVREQVVADRPEGASVPPTVPLDQQAELGWIVEWDREHPGS